MRVAVIGDVGGHLRELRGELQRLGADADGRLPDDLTVIQVGDLIHRGPESAGVVALVDHYLHEQPAQWTQLVGNHEAQYLREPAFDWPERLDERSVQTLQRWWSEKTMRVAASVSTPDEDFLITHAGLTCGYWRDVLDRLNRAALAAAALNSLAGQHDDVLFHAGQMLGAGRPDPVAGPVWAAAATELVPSWTGVRMPFSQVHGHSMITGSSGRRSVPAELLAATEADDDARHEITWLDSGRIIGVDPGHGTRPRRRWRSFVIEVSPGAD